MYSLLHRRAFIFRIIDEGYIRSAVRREAPEGLDFRRVQSINQPRRRGYLSTTFTPTQSIVIFDTRDARVVREWQ
jgi:hypothetical protein